MTTPRPLPDEPIPELEIPTSRAEPQPSGMESGGLSGQDGGVPNERHLEWEQRHSTGLPPTTPAPGESPGHPTPGVTEEPAGPPP